MSPIALLLSLALVASPQPAPADEPDPGLTLAWEKNMLTIEIADSGIGISEEDQKRIFDKFYRAKDPRVGRIVGTGLGLTLAREVMRLHGGEIVVDSQINKGSTFTLTLPISVEAV